VDIVAGGYHSLLLTGITFSYLLEQGNVLGSGKCNWDQIHVKTKKGE
jgi:hypothetical protein